MDIFSSLLLGFRVAFQPINFLYCFIGVFVGTLVGVLPGIGPIGAMSILFSLTYTLSPVSAIIMLAGIYYGCQYGGSTTSILLKIPGEATSIISCLDGHEMAKRGRAGVALGIAAFGSLIGGTLSLFGLVLLVFPLAQVGLKFGPVEFTSIILASMTALLYLGSGSVIKTIVMILLGFILATVGIDMISGVSRFNFGNTNLLNGIDLVPLAMGLFGISEVMMTIDEQSTKTILQKKIKNLLPNLDDWRRSIGPILRASFLGFFSGILPGMGAMIPTFLSYTLEKKLSKNPQEFGKGAIEGLAGPETANNAAANGAFVPLMALGIPPTATMAILVGALMVHGIAPSPLLITQHPDIFWGLIASMYLGNIMLVILNLPLIGLWVKVLQIPFGILMPFIVLFCMIGAYSVNNNINDLTVMVFFGVVGYALRKFGYELAPVLLAFVLGPMFEKNFRQSLIMSDGKFSIFVEKPISLVALIICLFICIMLVVSFYSKYKKTAETMS